MNSYKRTNGFSLAVVLVIVGALAGILSGISYNQIGKSRKSEAFIAGKEAAMIARAARLHARNQITLNPNLVNELSPLSMGPRDVPMDTLINTSLLPQNFARRDGTGNYFNALGQRIRVILANFPVDGNPALTSTVPTAYVVFLDNAKSTPNLMQDIVQSLRAEEIPVSAPVFNGATNITGPCRGVGTTVALWDSGCLRDTEYQILAGGAFVPGSFVIPAWRSVNFDSRVMMRFPQPEQPGLQTMLTDLSMGNCGAGFIQIPTDTGNEATDICQPVDDNVSTLTDNRKSILNIRNFAGKNLIVAPQVAQDVRTDTAGNRTLSANEVNGLTINGNLTASGDAKIYNGRVIVSNQVRAEKNISVLNPGATIPPSARIGTINTGGAVSNAMTVENSANFNSSNLSVASDIQNTAKLTVSQDVVSARLTKTVGSGQTISVSNDAVISGTVKPASVNVTGATNTSGYNYITGTLNGVNLTSTDKNFNIANSTAFRGRVTAANVEVTNAGRTANCEGDCPLRKEASQCQRLADLGIETYNNCMARFR